MEENTKRVVDLINERVNQVQSLLNHSYKTLGRGSDEFIKLHLYQLVAYLGRNIDIDVNYMNEATVDGNTGNLAIKPSFRFWFEKLQDNICDAVDPESRQDDVTLVNDTNIDRISEDLPLIVDFQEGETNGSYALFCKVEYLRENRMLHWAILQHFEKFPDEYGVKWYKEVYEEKSSRTIGLVFRGEDQCSSATLDHVVYTGDIDETFDILLGRVDLGKLLFHPY
jgi:hypothetical protein